MSQIEYARFLSTPETEAVQNIVKDIFAHKDNARVLEAGCGAVSRIQFPKGAHITGIDIYQDQLERNKELHERILGDMQTYVFNPASFDIIICWDVLEHVEFPQKAFDNFSNALKKGGLLILASPNIFSIKGLITKFTPHAFHVWCYRHLFGVPEAGTPGVRPFKTYLKWSMSPQAIRSFAKRHSLGIAYSVTYEFEMQKNFRRRFIVFDWIFAVFGVISKLVSLGYMDLNHTDYIFVLRKKAETSK